MKHTSSALTYFYYSDYF